MQVGLDLIELDRIERALRRASFRARVYTEAEQAYCESRANPLQSYAGRFAAKEAVGKALGCGVHFTWREIEVVGRPKPKVTLSGRTKAFADRIGAVEIDVSLTHSKQLAAAIAIVRLRDAPGES
jgi:holo-[acyl-carrier protein] synthase